jgi:hypothetical protein
MSEGSIFFTHQSHKCLKQPETNKETSYRHVTVDYTVHSGTAVCDAQYLVKCFADFIDSLLCVP